MKKRGHTRLCRETGYYLALIALVFGAAMMKQMNLLVLLDGMFIGLLLVNWRGALAAVRHLEVRRRLPQAIAAGETLTVSYELSSQRRWSGTWAITVEDRLRREGADREEPEVRPQVWFPYVGPGQSSTLVTRGRVPRRGRYRFGDLTVSTRFPFGLLVGRCSLSREATLMVYPRQGRLTRAWNAWRQEIAEGSRQRQLGRASGEFFGVREWHPGDHRRWIHWRSSAKHGTLVVRQFQQARSQGLAILLDLWQPESPSVAERENVELAVSLAATLVNTVCRQEVNQLFLGIAGDGIEEIQGPVSSAMREQALERLALVKAVPQTGLAPLVTHCLSCIEAGVPLVLISTRPLPRDDETLLGHEIWRRLYARPIRQINTASPALAEYFDPEGS